MSRLLYLPAVPMLLIALCAAVPRKTGQSLPDPTSEGAELVRLYCTQCHAAPMPALHNAQEWSRVLTKMETHAGLANMVDPESARHFSARALPVIEAYMRQHARDAK
jgi:hypothetical protein